MYLGRKLSSVFSYRLILGSILAEVHDFWIIRFFFSELIIYHMNTVVFVSRNITKDREYGFYNHIQYLIVIIWVIKLERDRSYLILRYPKNYQQCF